MGKPIHLLFTGGTISMQADPAAGGNVPAHSGEALVRFTGELEQISPFRVENWAMVPAGHLDLDRLWQLRERTRAVAESGEVSGVVVTQGTDIMEESAYLLDRTLSRSIPIAVTGAMRTSGDESWDGPRNLRDAALVAAHPKSRGRGAMVVFHGKVFAGHTAVKVHATDVDAFAAPYSGPIGRISDNGIEYSDGVGSAEGVLAANPPTTLSARVALVPVVVGDAGNMLDLARPGHDGVVVIAFGSGNVPPGAVPAIRRWIDEGKPVVLATRCPFGEVTPAYAFEGGGSRLVRMGVIPAGPRTPSQARMELTLALSAGVPYGS